ncbi:unnamed protein product [Brachionus calyciflorus]|uniref:Uncharacterized protein n=1 Tax=Brachionus calyciflorus TaxID=104777 RepID=A0A813TRQ7_9BILA|nr:unnamed protein product [Brachionus calyciflorus]
MKTTSTYIQSRKVGNVIIVETYTKETTVMSNGETTEKITKKIEQRLNPSVNPIILQKVLKRLEPAIKPKKKIVCNCVGKCATNKCKCLKNHQKCSKDCNGCVKSNCDNC